MMTTWSDASTGQELERERSEADSQKGKFRVLVLGLVMVATLMGALLYWFRREETPISEVVQTEP